MHRSPPTRPLKNHLLLFSLAIAILPGVGGCASVNHWLMTPSVPFDEMKPPPPPDYADPDSWAARPGMDSPALEIPPGVKAPSPEVTSRTDVFYVHPTTYFWRFAWNAGIHGLLSDAIVNITLRSQASAFNGAGEIYAPHYRQMTLAGFNFPDVMEKGLAIAYDDVRRAFQYFLEHDNEGRPIILAGHSQGSRLLKRLIREFFAGPPLRERLVAAYVLGTRIRHKGEIAEPGDLPICQTPDQTGCLISWRTFSEGAKIPSEAPSKYGSKRSFVCVNPLTWRSDEKSAPASANLGSIPISIVSLPRPIPDLVGARCADSILWINRPDDFWINFYSGGGDYHPEDFSLFYMNLRQNSERRTRSLFAH